MTRSKASEQGRGSASAGQGKATKSASSTKPASTKPAGKWIYPNPTFTSDNISMTLAAPKKDVKAKPNAKSAAAAERQKKKKEEEKAAGESLEH